jgi:hypothetical protein
VGVLALGGRGIIAVARPQAGSKDMRRGRGMAGQLHCCCACLQSFPATGGAGRTSILGVCPGCGGKGRLIEELCSTCDGDGRAIVQCSIKVRIPAGALGSPEPNAHCGAARVRHSRWRLVQMPVISALMLLARQLLA